MCIGYYIWKPGTCKGYKKEPPHSLPLWCNPDNVAGVKEYWDF